MSSDVEQLAADLQSLIDRMRSQSAQESQVLDEMERIIDDRMRASAAFLGAFGHLLGSEVADVDPTKLAQRFASREEMHRSIYGADDGYGFQS